MENEYNRKEGLKNIIAVTGTKGKTTVARMIESTLLKMRREVLLVDTDGWYLNNKQLGSVEDSWKSWGLVCSVCPGRFLYAIKNKPKAIAVLECSVGSSGLAGMGYSSHQVGVWTNVFDDHITGKRIKYREDIAKAKNFIVKKVNQNGWLIFNADDELVCTTTKAKIKKNIAGVVPVGENFSHYRLSNHLKKGGHAFQVEKNHLVYLHGKQKRRVLKFKKCAVTFNGQYLPSKLNLAYAFAAIAAFYKFDTAKMTRAAQSLEKFSFRHPNRLNVIEIDGVKVLVDFAHEKHSLKAVGELAHQLGNQVIGVLRLNFDRTAEHIQEVGQFIASTYDSLFVYDKLDGVHRSTFSSPSLGFRRKTGDVAKMFSKALKATGHKHVEMILNENKALQKALQIAQPGDIIVYIPNLHLENSQKKLQQLLKSLNRVLS